MTKLEIKLKIQLDINLEIKAWAKALVLVLIGVLDCMVAKDHLSEYHSLEWWLNFNTYNSRPTQPKEVGVVFHGICTLRITPPSNRDSNGSIINETMMF